jgi:Flagellar biosynthesis protein, FliO
MEPAQMEITQTLIRTGTLSKSRLVRVLAHMFTRTSALAAARLKVFRRSMIWTSLIRRAGSKRKTLSIRETAALGDRRFVSVIQFERQRFLIGSSPSSITLLSNLPDESASGEVTGKGSGEEN